jgi:hypothetical protein
MRRSARNSHSTRMDLDSVWESSETSRATSMTPSEDSLITSCPRTTCISRLKPHTRRRLGEKKPKRMVSHWRRYCRKWRYRIRLKNEMQMLLSGRSKRPWKLQYLQDLNREGRLSTSSRKSMVKSYQKHTTIRKSKKLNRSLVNTILNL